MSIFFMIGVCYFMVVNDRAVNAFISFLIPGLGHIIRRNVFKGFILFIIALIIDLIVFFYFNFWLGHLIVIIYAIFIARDAYASY